MPKEKKNLRDLVSVSVAVQSQSDSPYANLVYRYSPAKLQKYIESLTQVEKEEYLTYCHSPEGKREAKEFAARERRASLEIALRHKNRVFNERFSKLILKFEKSELLKERLTQAKTLTTDEIAQSLIIFPELLPEGHKAPALVIARKSLKAILSDKEKEYLEHVWACTSIPVDICYTQKNDHSEQSATNRNH